MPTPVFPSINPSYSLFKIPAFRTSIIHYGNKVEQRIAHDSTVRYRFRLRWKVLEGDDADTILAFFLARKGSFESFYLRNLEEAYRNKTWQANHAYLVGNIVRPVTANGRSYICITAGTTGSSEPTWPTTEGGTVNDGTVVWKENSYLVRFAVDESNFDYFSYSLYSLNETEFIEVSA